MTTTVKPAWGLAHVVPEDAIAAWGARLIVTQDGDVDILWDRQGSDGGPHSQALFQALEERYPVLDLKEQISELLRGDFYRTEVPGVYLWMQMSTREAEDFILHLDDRLVVHANTNSSAGYCYVTAWLYPEPTCTWQTSYGTGLGDTTCGDPVVGDLPYCPSHMQDLVDNYGGLSGGRRYTQADVPLALKEN